jgi:hypothetical protein
MHHIPVHRASACLLNKTICHLILPSLEHNFAPAILTEHQADGLHRAHRLRPPIPPQVAATCLDPLLTQPKPSPAPRCTYNPTLVRSSFNFSAGTRCRCYCLSSTAPPPTLPHCHPFTCPPLLPRLGRTIQRPCLRFSACLEDAAGHSVVFLEEVRTNLAYMGDLVHSHP